MKFGAVPTGEAIGRVLAHAVFLADGRLSKGTVLTPTDIAAIAAAGIASVFVAQLEPDDVDENSAARRVAEALLGPGTRIEIATSGRCNIFSKANGVFQVDAETIHSVNAIDEAVTVATLANFSPVYAGEMLATVKIIPFSVASSVLGRLEDRLKGLTATQVSAFRPKDVAVISTLLPRIKATSIEKSVRNLGNRLAIAGSRISTDIRVPHELAPLATALKQLADETDMVVVFGASATSDRHDILPAAIEAAGGCVEQFGMPVDPGNLLVLGSLDGKPVIGAPGCARSPKENGFDWVLWRLLAGLVVTPRDIQRMGVGGLLKEIPSRPQKRISTPPVLPLAAMVLAAGRGSRMGGGKMLAPVAGRPMIAHAVDLARAAVSSPVIVVSGHEGAKTRQILGNRDIVHVDNDAVDLGLSHSLRLGLQRVPDGAAGVIVLLGDMPAVAPGTIEALCHEAALDPSCKAIVPTFEGKRGNPVLLMRRIFSAVLALEGDKGARGLLTGQGIIELPVADPGILLDIDTPEERNAYEAALAGK